MPHLILIADYGSDGLASTEAILATRRAAATPFTVDLVASRPFNTIHTAFLLDQLHRGIPKGRGADTTFFLNTDPRTQTENGVAAAEGAPLVIATLDTGAHIVTPNAGHCLSLVRPRITSLALARCSAAGSQFRSRDVFPAVVGAVIDGNVAAVTGDTLSIDHVPPMPPEFIVLHIDNYGNVKTSFTERDRMTLGIAWGEEIELQLGATTMRIPVVENIFAESAGSLVFAPGSSGDRTNPGFEVSLRYAGDCSASAGAVFGHPEPGSNFAVRKI